MQREKASYTHSFAQRVVGMKFEQEAAYARGRCDRNVNAQTNSRTIVTMTAETMHYPPASKVWVFGHELAHTFDRKSASNTKIRQSGSQAYHPFDKAYECLRKQVGKFSLQNANPAQDTHSHEAICDLIGVDALEKYIQSRPKRAPPKARANTVVMPPGYENIFFALDLACADSLTTNDAKISHPAWFRRLKEIILRSPTVAATVGCSAHARGPRCDLKEGYIPDSQGLPSSAVKSSPIDATK